MDSFSHYLELPCSHYYCHVATAIRLLEEIPKQYIEYIFMIFLFQDSTPSSGSLSCRNTQEHSDVLVFCLLFLWQRRNDTAPYMGPDDSLVRVTKAPSYLNLKLSDISGKETFHEFVFEFHSMWDPSQSCTLIAQPIALQLHCWVGSSEKRPMGLQFGTWPKIKQVICHYYSIVTTGKPSVTLQEYFSYHVILMCASKRTSRNLIKNTKKNSYCQLPVLFSAQYKTFWLKRTPHRPSQVLIFQVHSLPKAAYGLDIPRLCKGSKKENINSSSSKHTLWNTYSSTKSQIFQKK